MADEKPKVSVKAAYEHKYVVLHTQVGPYPQGKLVPASQFGDVDLIRLKEIGAIRDAKPEEMKMDSVVITVHPSAGLEKDAMIEKLTLERDRLQEKNDRLLRELDITRQMKAPVPTPDAQKLNDILKQNAEKDVAIATLQNQISDLQSRLANGGGSPLLVDGAA